MPLQPHHIEHLKALYRKERGVDLDDKEAWAMAIRLVNLFRLLNERTGENKEVRTI